MPMPHFDIAQIIREIALLAVPFLLAITCHEVAHGYMANRLGDPTAKLAGRLTLNPLKHLDVLGTLVLVVTRMIGWAKPVPVDSRYFRDPLKGMMYVSLAGPGANFVLAIVFALLFHGLNALFGGRPLGEVELMFIEPLANIFYLGVQINLVLGLFNLLPIPPMDGSGILAYFLPRTAVTQYLAVGRYGFLVIILLAATGLLGRLLWPPVAFFMKMLLF
jgi:Zn-dependent protease